MTVAEEQNEERYTPEWYARMEAQRQARRDYRCYVTAENIGHISDRIENLVNSGRRMTMVEMIGESDRPYKVVAGLSLNTQGFGPAVERRDTGISVHLEPGIHGFGVHWWRWKTLAEMHAELDRMRAYRKEHGLTEKDVFGREPEHTYVEIEGGYSPTEFGREDSIVIRDLNQHGVMCTKHIAFDDDILRRPLREPYKWQEWDPEGDDAAEEVLAATPDHVKWAMLKYYSDLSPELIAKRRDDLDRQIRPWAHKDAS